MKSLPSSVCKCSVLWLKDTVSLLNLFKNRTISFILNWYSTEFVFTLWRRWACPTNLCFFLAPMCLHPLLTGKYMQMMNILKPIAFDVIHCVSQLFDYYLYAVYTFFGRNDMVQYFWSIRAMKLRHLQYCILRLYADDSMGKQLGYCTGIKV